MKVFKGVITTLAAASILAMPICGVAAIKQKQVIHKENYAPYTVITNEGKEVSGEEFERDYMCKEGDLAASMVLLKTFKVVGSRRYDYSMGSTTFAGKAQGRDVGVEVFVGYDPHINMIIMINGEKYATCGF